MQTTPAPTNPAHAAGRTRSGSDAKTVGGADVSSRLPLTVRILLRVYRPILRRAARSALEGRRVDPVRPEAGRFLRADVDGFLEEVWRRVTELLGEEDLRRIPSVGNRHNVLLGALTIAGYEALLDRGIERRYAIELFADVGWKIYERMLKVPFFLAGEHGHYERPHTLSRGDSVCDMCWSATSSENRAGVL